MPERLLAQKTERRRVGASMIVVVLALTALVAAVALSVDVGLTWAARTQLQGTVDGSALAAALNMIDGGGGVDLAAARTEGIAVGGANASLPVASVAINATDITFGNWDLSTRTLDTTVNLTIPDQVTAAQVVGRLETGTNQPVPAFFSRIVGRTDFPVRASAIGYLGFAGSIAPGEADLPIAIDCCAIAGSDCEQDYCAAIASPPNPCALESGNAGTGTVSCLEFQSTPEQNACWTAFDDQSPSVNTPDLSDIVENGNSTTVDVSDSFFVDNGDKTPVIGDIDDRFQGNGPFSSQGPAGVDRYAPTNGNVDSWVVGLPVIECQDVDHCAGGTTADIVGFVCFEIMEIEVTPGKIIRGRFLCPTDPLFTECNLGATGSGGENFGIRATRPVLVN